MIWCIVNEGGIVKNTLRPAIPEHCDPAWRKLMEDCWSPDPETRPSFTEITNRLRSIFQSKGSNNLVIRNGKSNIRSWMNTYAPILFFRWYHDCLASSRGALGVERIKALRMSMSTIQWPVGSSPLSIKTYIHLFILLWQKLLGLVNEKECA